MYTLSTNILCKIEIKNVCKVVNFVLLISKFTAIKSIENVLNSQ